MIDISKMKALATQLREWNWLNDQVPQDAADAIDSLLSELEASNQKRKEAVMDAERAREERNREHVKLNAEWVEKTAALRAELEAREADRRDAERYRWLRNEHFPTADNPPIAQVVWKEFDDRHGNQWVNMIDGNDLDRAIDAALAQRQEGEEK